MESEKDKYKWQKKYYQQNKKIIFEKRKRRSKLGITVERLGYSLEKLPPKIN